MSRIPWWYTTIGIVLFLLGQIILRQAIDLRDFPGAAGTLSLYRALETGEGSDWASWMLQWIQMLLNCTIPTAARFLSVICGVLSVVGAILGGWALGDRQGAVCSGVLASTWALTHYFSLLTGLDPLSMALPWLAVGLCWAGFRLGWLGIPLLWIGAPLISFAAQVKEAALPTLSLVLFAPMMIRTFRSNALLVSLPVALYSAYWGWEWFWPTQSQRVDYPSLHLRSLVQGWETLNTLRFRGMPEGKFVQLTIGAILIQLVAFRGIQKRIFIALAGGAVLLVTSHTLGELARPRYLAPATYGVLIALGVGLGQLVKRFQRGWLFTVAIALLLMFDGWSYFYVWGHLRMEMAGAREVVLPRPPELWLSQYSTVTDTTLRDISLYGGVELAELTAEHQQGIAIPRLRDERHRSLMAFAAMYDSSFVVLDIGDCCAGLRDQKRCAQRVVQQLDQAGLMVIVPTTIEGVSRVHANEENWRSELEAAVKDLDNVEESSFWVTRPASAKGEDLPCQSKAPFRSPK